MPARKIPQTERDISDALRSMYGGMMTLTDIGQELGISHRDSIVRWITGMPCVKINGRKKWMVKDVARRINENYYI